MKRMFRKERPGDDNYINEVVVMVVVVSEQRFESVFKEMLNRNFTDVLPTFLASVM